jgi:pimeloyl-ACP methyl ester carboxylesterase
MCALRLFSVLVLLLAVGCTPEESDPWAEGCDVAAPEFRDIDVGAVTLNVACRGSGPTVVLLHGFPEFWFGWDKVMDELASEFRLIVPDQRGYNLSEKPAGVFDYELPLLVDDIAGLIDVVGGPVTLVGHDWGGGVAWAAAGDLPDRVERLVIMNAPHMNVFGDLLANDEAQQDAFSYLDLFLTPGFEETMVSNDFGFLAVSMGDVLSDEELVLYKEAWGQPGAIEGGLNWYRANFGEGGLPNVDRELRVEVPTLVMWGMDDTALLPSNMVGLDEYVSDLTLEEVEGATHWIAHEVPERVASSIRAFVP